MPNDFITAGTKLLMARRSEERRSRFGNCIKHIPEGEDMFCPSAVTNGRAPLFIPQGP